MFVDKMVQGESSVFGTIWFRGNFSNMVLGEDEDVPAHE